MAIKKRVKILENKACANKRNGVGVVLITQEQGKFFLADISFPHDRSLNVKIESDKQETLDDFTDRIGTLARQHVDAPIAFFRMSGQSNAL